MKWYKNRCILTTLGILSVLLFISIHKTLFASVIITPIPSMGLSAYWSFDSRTLNWASNTIADISGNSNNGTLVNMDENTNQVAGKKGQALFFDGNFDSVSLSSNPISTVANPSTICAWVNTSDINSAPGAWDQTFLNLYTDSNNGIRMGSLTGSGAFFASYRVGGTYYGAHTTTEVFLNNIWSHVCYVWDGNGISLYANSVSLATTTNNNSMGNVNTIGARNDQGDGTWSGTIDDLRIYNRALSATEIRQIYQSGAFVLNSLQGNKTVTLASTPVNFLTNGLVGYWSFDGSKTNWATGQVTDSSGGGNTGSMISMSTTTSPAQGKMGQALSFDGDNDHIVVPDPGSSSLDITDDMTISTWIKRSSTSGRYEIILNKDPSNQIYALFLHPNDTLIFYTTLGGSVNGPTFSDTESWHHLVVTKNGTTVTFYLDAVSSGGGTQSSASVATNDANLVIGASSFGDEEIHAQLDDLRIYNRALSVAEVKKLYLLGR